MKCSFERLREYIEKNFPSDAIEWFNNLDNTIAILQNKWQFGDYTAYERSHFGVVLFSNSDTYGKVVIKIVPPFINRFNRELSTYKIYSDKVMCPILDYDTSLCALLLKQADGGEYIDFMSSAFDREQVRLLFNKVTDNFKYDVVGEYFTYYEKDLKDKLNALSDLTYKGEIISQYVIRAVELYDQCFANDKICLIHGDLHRYNIIYDNRGLIGIDPIGYLAPREIEYARFIGTVFTEEKNDLKRAMDTCLHFFLKYTDRERLNAAIFIDIVFRLHNATFEDGNNELVDKWIRILAELKL